MLMAACSFYVSYPSQFPAEPVMNGQRYIQEELVFDQSQCTQPDTSSTEMNNFSSEKRSSMLQDYFKSSNAMSRSIMLEKCTVEQQHSKQWTVLSDSKRDEIVDEYFVPNVVREQYEAGLISRPQWQSGSKQSLERFHYSSQGHLDDDQYDGEQIDGISMSQPSNIKIPAANKEKYGSNKMRSNSAAQILDLQQTSSGMQKLRSFSIRSKKNGKQNKQSPTKQQNEMLPLFTRDVYELDNDVDLPDESLLTDHIGAMDDDSFARLKPLRYSFGRKMRHKISQSPDNQSSEHSGDGFVFSNDGIDYLDSSMQDLTQATNNILYNESISTQDLSILERDGSMMDPTSPVHMMSDDAISIMSSSRSNTRTPDSSLPIRISPSRIKSSKGDSNHPLSRSVRAGSSYMTVTSSFADSRRQMFMKKKNNSTSPTRESTPINSPATSPPPLCVVTPEVTKSHPPLKQYHSVIPIVKTESVNESIITDSTNSSSELPSPLCSPPSSPAGLCPNTGRNKRESGYISSTYTEELSDDEEGSKNKTNIVKRKPKRKLKVERTESFNH